MKLIKYNVVLFMLVVFHWDVWATYIEMDIYNPGNFYGDSAIGRISPPSKNQPSSSSSLSPVVRIENRNKRQAKNLLARAGTGVVIGRFKETYGYFFRAREGVLVLTANHVLVANKNEDQDNLISRLTFFDSQRHYHHTRSFRVLSTNPAEDMALLEVEMDWDQASSIQLPQLGLLEPSQFANYTWIPKYYRVNPGPIDKPELTYSEISPSVFISMVTKDAMNSLAINTDYFWSIPSEFIPGMSGGPVFSGEVNTYGVKFPHLNQLLVGIMGYIFDRSSQYGYAYPLTRESLNKLLDPSSSLNYQVALNNVQQLISDQPYLKVTPTSKLVWIETDKKQSPVGGVADEIQVMLNVRPTEIEGGGSNISTITFTQRNEFEPVFSINPRGFPFAEMKDENKSTGQPAGGSIEGSPGGGTVEGSPGGRGTDRPKKDTEDSGEDKKSSPKGIVQIEKYIQKSIIEVYIFDQGSGLKRYILDRVNINGALKPVDYLKDLISYLKSDLSIKLVMKSKEEKSPENQTYSGSFNLKPLQSDIPILQNMGFLVSLGKIKGKYIKAKNALTLNLSFAFRDTKEGFGHHFLMKLGFILNPINQSIKEVRIQKYFLDNKEINMPKEIQFLLEDGFLKAYYLNQKFFEVKL